MKKLYLFAILLGSLVPLIGFSQSKDGITSTIGEFSRDSWYTAIKINIDNNSTVKSVKSVIFTTGKTKVKGEGSVLTWNKDYKHSYKTEGDKIIIQVILPQPIEPKQNLELVGGLNLEGNAIIISDLAISFTTDEIEPPKPRTKSDTLKKWDI